MHDALFFLPEKPEGCCERHVAGAVQKQQRARVGKALAN
jgi:hypothetical protein